MRIELVGGKVMDTTPIRNSVVQGESGADVWEFRLPRYYGNVDLLLLSYKLRLVTEKDTITEQLLAKGTTDTGISLRCTVSSDMAAVSGKAWLELIGTDTDGGQVIKFTGAEIYIKPSLSGMSPPPKEYLESMLAQMMGTFSAAITEVDSKIEEVARLSESLTQKADAAAMKAETQAAYAKSVGDDLKQKFDSGKLTGPRGGTGEAGPRGAKGDKGDTGLIGPIGPQGSRGDSGVVTPISGLYALSGDADGNMYAHYAEGSTPPSFEANSNGDIYCILPDD